MAWGGCNIDYYLISINSLTLSDQRSELIDFNKMVPEAGLGTDNKSDSLTTDAVRLGRANNVCVYMLATK